MDSRVPPMRRASGARLLRGDPPASHLEDGLGHVVPADILVQSREDPLGAVDGLAEEPRREDAHEGRPGGVERLRGIVGLVVHDALAPAVRAIRVVELAEEDAAVAHLAGRDAERFAEREADLAEDDAVERDHERRVSR